MKAHVIENSVVVNTIEVDSLNFLPNLVEATEGGIGWSYADEVFTAPVIAFTAEEIRKERNAKLAETDWTQVADAPVNQEDWAAYRALLRSIPEQEGFPNEVTWPTEPVAEEPVA